VQANSNTPDWPYPSAKVGDPATTLHEGRHDPVGLGVNIDVFPLDALPFSSAAHAVDRRVIEILRRLHAIKMAAPRAGRAAWKKALLALACLVLAPLPAHRLGLAWDRRAARPIGHDTNAAGIRVGSYDWAVPSSVLGDGVEVKFAGMALRAPANPDYVLRTMFGEYLQLPPEDRRVSHHVFTAHRGPCSARLDPPCPT
jgi:lipopolysaccharide cholinephosphotransferase